MVKWFISVAVVAFATVAQGQPTCPFTSDDIAYWTAMVDVGGNLPQLIEQFDQCRPAQRDPVGHDRCSSIARDAKAAAERTLRACKPMRVSRAVTPLKRKTEAALAALSSAFGQYAQPVRDVGAERDHWRDGIGAWKQAMEETELVQARIDYAIRDGRCKG